VITPKITKSFGGSTFYPPSTTTLTIDITNPSSTQTLTNVGVVDNLPSSPSQMTIENTTGTTQSVTGCGSATYSFPNGATSFVISNATIAPGGDCNIQMTVTATALGTYNNTTNPVTTSQGSFGTASASITGAPIP
jgi:hypothetical protein